LLNISAFKADSHKPPLRIAFMRYGGEPALSTPRTSCRH